MSTEGGVQRVILMAEALKGEAGMVFALKRVVTAGTLISR